MLSFFSVLVNTVFSIFTEPYNYHYHLILEGFHHPQESPHVHLQAFPTLAQNNHKFTLCLYALPLGTCQVNGLTFLLFTYCIIFFRWNKKLGLRRVLCPCCSDVIPGVRLD